MAVQHLVDLFNAQSGTPPSAAAVPEPQTHRASPSRRISARPQSPRLASPKAAAEQPARQARFIKHPLLHTSLSATTEQTTGLPHERITTNPEDATNNHDPFDDNNALPEATEDIANTLASSSHVNYPSSTGTPTPQPPTSNIHESRATDEGSLPLPARTPSSPPSSHSTTATPSRLHPPSDPPAQHGPGSRMKNWLSSVTNTTEDPDDTSEHAMLLGTMREHNAHFLEEKPSFTSRSHNPSPSLASTSTTIQPGATSRASTATLASTHLRSAHTPIPLTTIFARDAAPLYLPQLDVYTSTLAPPMWTCVPCASKEEENGKEVKMFPPMDALAATGKSIEDLETNTTVAPWWRNKTGILGIFNNAILGLTGSSFFASYYSLTGVFNTVQIFALMLSTIIPNAGRDLGDKWKQLFLGTIPNILAFNWASTIVQSLLFLLIFMCISTGLLWYFYRCTERASALQHAEGLQRPDMRAQGRGIVPVTFLLAVIYLPLSTMSVHVLVWSKDLWVVELPDITGQAWPPDVDPLGPEDEYWGPLEFCWTTTMKRNAINWAPALVVLAVIVCLMLTIWFPLRLRKAINQSVPKVDQYTELGKPRSNSEMNREYQRLLARDQSPFAFLYREFRRGWGTFESTYLLTKFSALLIVAVIAPENCLFRSFDSTQVQVVRQGVLLAATIVFLLIQCFLAPHLNPVNNASEWTSRTNYVVTTVLALLVALNVPGKSVFDGVVLYIVYIITYFLSFYFVLIDTGFAQRLVKRWSGRLDFSIDIFSPRIDVSPSSPHTRRRIWQESISALLLTSPHCKIPDKQPMRYAQAPDSEYPPYLLDFAGSIAERHVENLKILRESGTSEYLRAVALLYGPDNEWFQPMAKRIQENFVGPDCYWKDPEVPEIPGCTRFFGNAWWIPFPPTVVIRYDDGPLVAIKDTHQLQLYVLQNSSVNIRRRKEIRLALRALDGRKVTWPYRHIENIGTRKGLCCGRRYKAQKTVDYHTGTLRIAHRGQLTWEGLHLGSGFTIELAYDKHVRVPGGALGLTEDYDLTPPLARFLTLNERLIPSRLAELEASLSRYRTHCAAEAHAKAWTLSYRFLASVYDSPEGMPRLAENAAQDEPNERAQDFLKSDECRNALAVAYERLDYVSQSEVATWWYIFWDDLWRRNNDTIKQFQVHALDFNPHYPTSIAYRPLPRPALEVFLAQRGLLHKKRKFGDFFHSGFLNKMYLRLNDVAFHDSGKAFILHMGDDASELDMEDIDVATQARPSTLGTGAGTDHDDEEIRARPAYRWEGILSDAPRKRHWPWWVRWPAVLRPKFGAWFGLTPNWTTGERSNGVSLDVKLEGGRYVLLHLDSRDNSTMYTK